MSNPYSKNLPDAQFLPHDHDDEISLIDLAKILVRRRWWIMGVGGVVFSFFAAFALLSSQTYQMTSIYRVSEKAIGEPLEAPDSLIKKVESLYWSAVERESLDEHGQQVMPYALHVSNPANTSLILLTTSAKAAEQSVIEGLHKQVLSELADEQASNLQARLQQLGHQLDNTRHLLSEAQQRQNLVAAEMAKAYSARIFDLEDRLEGYRAGAVVQYAALGKSTTQLSRSLMLVLGAMAGMVVGLIAAFLAEFVARVRQSLKESDGARSRSS